MRRGDFGVTRHRTGRRRDRMSLTASLQNPPVPFVSCRIIWRSGDNEDSLLHYAENSKRKESGRRGWARSPFRLWRLKSRHRARESKFQRLSPTGIFAVRQSNISWAFRPPPQKARAEKCLFPGRVHIESVKLRKRFSGRNQEGSSVSSLISRTWEGSIPRVRAISSGERIPLPRRARMILSCSCRTPC